MLGIGFLANSLFGAPEVGIALLSCLVFAILNIVGTKMAGFFEILVVVGLLVIMVGFVVVGLPHVSVLHFDNFAPHGGNSILLTTGFVFVSYGGLLKVASVSEEVDNPKRNIPLALFSSLFVVVTLYCFILIVTIGTLPAETLSGSLSPIAESARTFMGEPGYTLLVLAALFAFVSTANAGIMAASRYPLALSRDHLLPQWVSRTSTRTKTPIAAISLTSVVIALVMFLPLETLVKAASTVVILSYILAHLSIVILRESRIKNYRPSFRSPLYPWVQISGIFCFLLLLVDMGRDVLLISLGLVFLGIIFYFAYGRKRASKESALLNLMARILSRDMDESDFTLEEELKDIVHSRDEVALDGFDRMVEKAGVLIVDHVSDLDDIFKLVAEEVSKLVGESTDQVLGKLLSREKGSSTAITDFTAVPHLVIEQPGVSGLFLVKSEIGVKFSENSKSVKSLFFLFGSKSERLEHLQALAGIAQIIQGDLFEQEWLAAKTPQQIKDLLLLSERNRL
jgi:mannitol/fructose-specific phosphotransferase system IIA component (Ntr-type)